MEHHTPMGNDDGEEIDVPAPRAPSTPAIQSLVTGLQVLKDVSEMGGPQTLAAIAKAVGMSRTKTYKYLISLEQEGFLERRDETARYSLGPSAIRIGMTAMNSIDILKVAAAELPAVAQRLHLSAFLSVWNGGGIIMHWENAATSYSISVRVGYRPPMLQSTPGYVFGAFLPESTTRATVMAELNHPKTKEWNIESYQDARNAFATVREQGFARQSGHLVPGLEAVSVPVFSVGGILAGVITCIGLSNDVELIGTERIVNELRATSEQISAKLGLPSNS